MRVAITDANIFIDLCEIELINEFFQLELEIHTTQEVLDEVEGDCLSPYIDNIILKIFTAKEIEDLPELEVAKKLSLTDRTIIALSEEIEGIVLTGDGLLRKTLEERELEVHGIIWVFDQLLEQDCISHRLTSSQKNAFYDEIGEMVSIAADAVRAPNQLKATTKWRKIFGNRFYK